MAPLTGPREIVGLNSIDEERDRLPALDGIERSGGEDRIRANVAVRRLLVSLTPAEKEKLRPLPERLLPWLSPLPWRPCDVLEVLGPLFFWSDLCHLTLCALRNLAQNPPVWRKGKMTADWLREYAEKSPAMLARLVGDENPDRELARAAHDELIALVGGIGNPPRVSFADDRTFLQVERYVAEHGVSLSEAFRALGRSDNGEDVRQAYYRVKRR